MDVGEKIIHQNCTCYLLWYHLEGGNRVLSPGTHASYINQPGSRQMKYRPRTISLRAFLRPAPKNTFLKICCCAHDSSSNFLNCLTQIRTNINVFWKMNWKFSLFQLQLWESPWYLMTYRQFWTISDSWMGRSTLCISYIHNHSLTSVERQIMCELRINL